MTNKEIVLSYISKLAGKAICDDCMSEKMGITPRQQINQICNELASSELIYREEKGDCQFCHGNKIVNLTHAHEQNKTETSPTKFEIFKVALDTRNMEIALFWQRSNYFLALNTAIAVGFFAKGLDNGSASQYASLLALLGIIVSVLWFRVNCGSKYWQSRWEHRLKMSEEKLPEKIDFFAAEWPTIDDDVRKSLGFSKHQGLGRWFDGLVLRKYSVSRSMILLSGLFILFWSALLLMSLCD